MPRNTATLPARTDARGAQVNTAPAKVSSEALEATLTETIDVLSGALGDLLRISGSPRLARWQRRTLVDGVQALRLADRHTVNALKLVRQAGGQ